MTQFELLSNNLKDKIPTISKLVDYQAFIKEITICNRSGNNTIACNMHHVKFFEFCKKNKIELSDNLIQILKNILNIGFDLESLYTDRYRIYIDRKSMVLNAIWKKASEFPLELIDCKLLENQVQQNNILLKEKNKEMLDRIQVDTISTNYPIVLTCDSWGSYSVVDGIHRIKKSQKDGKTEISAHVIPMEIFHDLVQNAIHSCLSNELFLNGTFLPIYTKTKDLIEETNRQIKDDLTIESLQSIAFYFDKNLDSIATWKLYFKNKTTLIQQKLDSIGNQISFHQEFRSNDSDCYRDNLEIVERLSNFKLVSSHRTDIDQTYLGIRL